MTKDELKSQLAETKFEFWRDDEFHRDVYTNKSAKVTLDESKSLIVNLELFVDYYTLRIVWWLEKGKKVTKSYYMKRDVEKICDLNELLGVFVSLCSTDYGVDLNKYAV